MCTFPAVSTLFSHLDSGEPLDSRLVPIELVIEFENATVASNLKLGMFIKWNHYEPANHPRLSNK